MSGILTVLFTSLALNILPHILLLLVIDFNMYCLIYSWKSTYFSFFVINYCKPTDEVLFVMVPVVKA